MLIVMFQRVVITCGKLCVATTRRNAPLTRFGTMINPLYPTIPAFPFQKQGKDQDVVVPIWAEKFGVPKNWGHPPNAGGRHCQFAAPTTYGRSPSSGSAQN